MHTKIQPYTVPNIAFSTLAKMSNRAFRPVKPKILILAARGRESLTKDQNIRLGSLAEVHYHCVLKPLTPDEFVKIAWNYDYIAITRRAIHRLGQETLSALPRLKGISVYSTGTEWIDTSFLRERGIQFNSLPDYCTNAVAETALGLLFLSAHKFHLRYLKTTHAIPEYVSLRGRELYSGTVGIIGYGRIGRLLAKKIQPLCNRILVHDIDPEQLNFLPSGIVVVGMEALLHQADWVVCCASQSYDEKPILNDGDYALLRPETTLINVARTSLFDHERLVEMVKNRQLNAYFYDDLLQPEEKPNEVEFGKIVPMGHTAWYTNEAMERGTETWVENLRLLIKNSPTTHKTQISTC